MTHSPLMPNLPGNSLGVARLVTLESPARRAREDRARLTGDEGE
jgi:hypothetical protein